MCSCMMYVCVCVVYKFIYVECLWVLVCMSVYDECVCVWCVCVCVSVSCVFVHVCNVCSCMVSMCPCLLCACIRGYACIPKNEDKLNTETYPQSCIRRRRISRRLERNQDHYQCLVRSTRSPHCHHICRKWNR